MFSRSKEVPEQEQLENEDELQSGKTEAERQAKFLLYWRTTSLTSTTTTYTGTSTLASLECTPSNFGLQSCGWEPQTSDYIWPNIQNKDFYLSLLLHSYMEITERWIILTMMIFWYLWNETFIDKKSLSGFTSSSLYLSWMYNVEHV